MNRIKMIGSMLLMTTVVSCSTPGPVTGRTDPNVTTSGTAGSAKMTERPANLPVPPDSNRRDTTIRRN